MQVDLVKLTVYINTYKSEHIFFRKLEVLDLHSMLEHAKFVWGIRTSLTRNQRHWTHILYWNMQSLLGNQDISSEKSEALDSQTMLEHAKVVWAMRTSLLRNQRHWAHILCWSMQMLFEQWGYLFWEIRGTGPTCYVGTCKGCLSNENIFSEKSEVLNLQTMLEHAKIVWEMRISLLRNQRHWTHKLCWNMQRSFQQSGHLF